MFSNQRTLVLWNKSSGSAGNAEQLREQLASLDNVTIHDLTDFEQARDKILKFAENSGELVIAAGGDGTVSFVSQTLMSCPNIPSLGILPLGTGNDLSRSLQIPVTPEDALIEIENSTIRKIDVANYKTNQTQACYINMLTGGNTGRYLEYMTDEIKKRWGAFCYLRGVLSLVKDLTVYDVEIICDNEAPEKFKALNIFAANGAFSGGGLAVSPDANLDDGFLDLIIVKDGEPVEIASLTAGYVFSDFLKHDLIEFRRVRKIHIHSNPPMSLTADGETIGETPITVEVKPQSLPVILPNENQK